MPFEYRRKCRARLHADGHPKHHRAHGGHRRWLDNLGFIAALHLSDDLNMLARSGEPVAGGHAFAMAAVAHRAPLSRRSAPITLAECVLYRGRRSQTASRQHRRRQSQIYDAMQAIPHHWLAHSAASTWPASARLLSPLRRISPSSFKYFLRYRWRIAMAFDKVYRRSPIGHRQNHISIARRALHL